MYVFKNARFGAVAPSPFFHHQNYRSKPTGCGRFLVSDRRTLPGHQMLASLCPAKPVRSASRLLGPICFAMRGPLALQINPCPPFSSAMPAAPPTNRTLPRVAADPQQKELRRMYDTGAYSIRDLEDVFSASRPTVYRTLAREAEP